MPRRLSGNRSRHPRNDPSSESSVGMGTRNPIPTLLRIRFLRRRTGSAQTVAFRTHPRRRDRDSIALRTAGLGVALFRRRPRPLTLTDAGARLLPGISEGLATFAR